MDKLDVVVIGAGVVGLAVARSLALSGREVMVLEREPGIGMGTSSRNSEVIHAGIYYPAGSLKARLCVRGRELLYRYCAERGVGHQRCGKLIVAHSPSQVAGLPAIAAKARVNGVNDLVMLDAHEALAMEPRLKCEAALLSPSTGIVDSHGLMLAIQGDLERAGGLVACHSEVVGIDVSDNGLVVQTADGTALLASTVVNAAGLQACDLASRFVGLGAAHVPRSHFAKGNYFSLATGLSPFQRLIYPAPEPDKHLAGLGVHLTIDLGGQVKFGPDVQWVEQPDDYVVDSARGEAFYAEVRKYWPDLPDGALQPGYAGVRPKISGPDEPAADFRIDGPAVHGVPGLINLFGIESPGLTSCLAIGDHVAALAA
ncbi:MAG: NAD(P)/FAD-dependent oxidoreductase [Hydrogenophaga sp.]|nr:NAD(P)/FAD-dependent oxidoreductase [Hydrogenophaga sp.]